jgi:transcriptional regulator with XRE-family HTH domain
VSQTETLTNVEKGKLLREARQRLGLTQEEMAKALGLDKTYLSQFENGHREIDSFYLRRAEEIEKSKKVNDAIGEQSGTKYDAESIQAKCHGHLSGWLKQCAGNEHELSWTFVELQRRFPLKQKPAYAPSAPEKETTARAQIGVASVLAEAQRADAESSPSQTRPSTSGKGDAPEVPSRPHPTRRQTPPKRAPK